MAAAADWYADPTREGRLRYWDGTRWTEHVSEDGGTAVEPVAGLPPAPPAVAAPAAADPPPAPGEGAAPGAYPLTLVGRLGFVVAAVGGVLTGTTNGSTAVEQGELGRIEVAGGAWIGIVAAFLCLAAAAAPWPWARVTGVAVSSTFALLVAFAVIGFRTSDDLFTGLDVSLGPAGWMMLASSLLLFAGTAIALWFLRVPVTAPAPEGVATPGSGKSVASLVLGIVGVLVPVLAAPAIALALFAFDDIRAAGGRMGGRGLAVAGLVLGIVSLSLWGVGLTLGMLLAQP
ncbi:DUF2510 domain-containing protein [Miltoncostaea marina]|uniref:DUF2510 domain-containing protein n=1 Tax=Miltoncostaea marina TaxID=2843215 RepID=UPI001C3D9B05|nr:DUF2510 domain-containing protein [Miltoncostaea marina]